MRMLVLSCSTGQGHDSCARAVKEHFEARDWECEVDDALAFVSPALSRFLAWGHSTMYRRFPWLFRAGYRFSERHPDAFWRKLGIYRVFALGSERMAGRIESGGFDAVACTHAFAGVMLTDVLECRPLPVATCLVGTDYTCNPGTKDSRLDAYFVPAPSLVGLYACPAVPEEKMVASGIPLRGEFYLRTPRPIARRELGIPEGCAHVLVMCGSMGCGPMERLVRGIVEEAPDGTQVTVVCGTNRRLRKRLARRHAGNPAVHVLGFTEDVPLLMDSADLFVTKPGGLTVTEAAAKRLPMVLVDAVAGCEEPNREFFVRSGGAVTGESVRELVEAAVGLLARPDELERMRGRLAVLPGREAPALLCDRMEELVRERKTAAARARARAGLRKDEAMTSGKTGSNVQEGRLVAPGDERQALVAAAARLVALEGAGPVTLSRAADAAGVGQDEAQRIFGDGEGLERAALSELAAQIEREFERLFLSAGREGREGSFLFSGPGGVRADDLAAALGSCLSDLQRAEEAAALCATAVRDPEVRAIMRRALRFFAQTCAPFAGESRARMICALVEGAVMDTCLFGEPFDADALSEALAAVLAPPAARLAG